MKIRIITTLLLAGLASDAFATNGYFRLGYGQNSIAMAGTGTALAQDEMAGATNPATIFGIDKQFGVALSLFNPNRGYEVTGASQALAQPPAPPFPGDFALALDDVTSASDVFLIPSLGYKRELNDQWAVNMVLHGNGGMNTTYSESVFMGGKTGVDLMQALLNTSIAYRFNDETHVGVAPIIGYQRFEAKGLQNFAGYSSEPSALTDEGHEDAFGFGMRFGVWHRLNENFTLGASAQTAINFSEFDQYRGLFAEQGGFDIPRNHNLGVTYQNKGLTLALDYQKINFSETKSVGNPMFPNIAMTQLGDDAGAGFGWSDMEIYKLGVALEGSNNDTFRAGVSYGEQPIDRSEVLFNILAPGVQEWHYTLGYELETQEANYAFTLMYSPKKTVKGKNPLYFTQDQFIELEMDQFELTFAVSF